MNSAIYRPLGRSTASEILVTVPEPVSILELQLKRPAGGPPVRKALQSPITFTPRIHSVAILRTHELRRSTSSSDASAYGMNENKVSLT